MYLLGNKQVKADVAITDNAQTTFGIWLKTIGAKNLYGWMRRPNELSRDCAANPPMFMLHAMSLWTISNTVSVECYRLHIIAAIVEIVVSHVTLLVLHDNIYHT